MRQLLLVLCLLNLATGARAAEAQVISVEHVANLGDTVGRGIPIGSLTDLIVLDDERILVSDLRNQRVLLFDETGSFDRPVGRVGQGVGEYSPGVIFARGDDGGAELFTAGRKILHSGGFDDPVTHPVRSRVATSGLTRVGEHYVRGGVLRTEESVGLPIHLFSRQRTDFLRSFGAAPPIRDVQNRSLFRRRFSASSDSTFWSADLFPLRVQHWTVEGTLLEEFVREPEWLPRQTETEVDPVAGPRPLVAAISYDSTAHVLWIATAIAREDWSDAPTRADLFGPIGQPSIDNYIDLNSAYRTVVEAIDPETGEVLGRSRIRARVRGISRGNFAFAESRSPDGRPVVRVWRLRMDR